jgi:hypothetical protein
MDKQHKFMLFEVVSRNIVKN